MTVDTTGIRKTVDRVEAIEALDRVSEPAKSLVQRVLPRRVRDFLNGVWLGHPLHPALVQVPVGSWVSASVLDMASISMQEAPPKTGWRGLRPERSRWRRPERSSAPATERGATILVGAGSASVIPAALAGWADWSTLAPEQRRVGLVHATSNLVALGLQTASFVMRLTGRQPAGRRLSMAGLTVAAAGAYLGGHMAYRQAAAVNQAAPRLRHIPDGWHSVGAYDELPEGAPKVREVAGVPILVVRDGDALNAMIGTCAHESGPLGDGKVEQINGQKCIVCPWHGSTYRLSDGVVLRGPAATDQPALRVRVSAGQIEVARP
jgi:nitrite reductase/ring-hydroxylating ferredoxin subunit/uncharacterized membrane protein